MHHVTSRARITRPGGGAYMPPQAGHFCRHVGRRQTHFPDPSSLTARDAWRLQNGVVGLAGGLRVYNELDPVPSFGYGALSLTTAA